MGILEHVQCMSFNLDSFMAHSVYTMMKGLQWDETVCKACGNAAQMTPALQAGLGLLTAATCLVVLVILQGSWGVV